MKKFFAIILAAVMVLSCSSYAFATERTGYVEYDNTKNPIPKKHSFDGEGPYTLPDDIPDRTSDTRIVGVEAHDKVDVTIKEDVNNDYWEKEGLTYNSETGVTAGGDAKVTVDGMVKNANDDGVTAMDNANVTVAGCIDSKKTGVRASGNATVTANGENASDAIHGYGDDCGYGAYVTNGATVIANGNIATEGENAINIFGEANGATVEVDGDARVEGDGFAVHFEDGSAASKVKISGDAIVLGDGYAVAIESTDADNLVIVEGTAKGDLYTGGGMIFVGKLQGEIDNGEDNVFYLIGTADGSASFDSLIVTGNIPIDPIKTIDGVKKRNYHYTATADPTILSGTSLTLKPSDSKKKLVVKGISTDADVTLTPNADGTVTLTLGSNFKGGLQDLMLILEDIIVKNSSGGGSTQALYTGTWNAPVTNGRWTKNADGTWSYATSRKFTSTWGCIANPNDANSAAWYYFDRNGNMLTGWQKLYWNGAYRWYYFSQTKDANEGKCQLGGITPDGYRVGADGAWIED